MKKTAFIIILLTLLPACTTGLSDTPGEEFEPVFIKAAALAEKIGQKDSPAIFDVRDKFDYDKGHIKTAASLPMETITQESVKDINKNDSIVTYCGCPHHLSTLAAEKLTNFGYSNVRVLDEGYWYWLENKYPVEGVTDEQLSELKISGYLLKSDKSMANQNIFLRHVKTGQLEASRTDARGYYEINFHLYNYQNNDQFNFYLNDLQNPVQSFSTNKKISTNVQINL